MQADATPFNSKLDGARERFLAAVVDHALAVGRRKPADFLRHFSAREIMLALRDKPALRANILSPTTGLNERVALKKSAESAGDDLAIALAEKVTTDAAVVELFHPDDRVRYLDAARLWGFVAEGEFWKKPGTPTAVARKHIAFILARARAEKLVSDREIVDGIGLDILVLSLPKADVVRLLERGLGDGRNARPFTDDSVLDVLPPEHLVEHVELAHLWDRIVAPKLSFDGGASELAPVSGATLEISPDDSEGDVVIEAYEGEDADDGGDPTASLDVDAMLSRVVPSKHPSDPPPSEGDRPTLAKVTSAPPAPAGSSRAS